MSVPAPSAVIDRETVTFRMEREFNHPGERVFRAWTSCEHVTQWWGPTDFTLPVCDMDFRPGGTWFYGMYHPGFGLNHGLMEFTAIEAPSLIEFVDHFVDADRTINAAMPARAAGSSSTTSAVAGPGSSTSRRTRPSSSSTRCSPWGWSRAWA
jgi:uncharacterized protein YndB with AHSA1/START domain